MGKEKDLKQRTKQFALKVIRFIETLPSNPSIGVISKQLLRCGTSVGANYRAACRARSRADFISKMTIVEEEADESKYWLELFVDSGLVAEESVLDLYGEADELTAIIVSSILTAKRLQ